MDRRTFVRTCAAAAIAGGAGPVSVLTEPSPASTSLFPFSVMLWTIEPKLPFDRRIGIVADAGYRAIELVGEYDHWSKDDYAKARKQLHSLNMVVDASSGVKASLCDPAERDNLLAAVRARLPLLAELECSQLILLTGNVVPGLTREQMHANCVDSLKRVAEITIPENVELLLENIDPEENPRYFLTSVTEGFKIIREIDNPKVKFLYDFFHEQISEGNLIAKLETNLDRIGLLHVADVPGRHEPGTGEINYASIFRKLGEIGYSRYVAMEFLPTGDVVTALRAAREFAEKNAAEGRALRAQNPREKSRCA